VLRDGVPADAATAAAKAKQIQDYVKNVLAPYKYPRDVRFTAALPRNASGKLQHFALRAVLADEGLESEQAVPDLGGAGRKETLA
jgi:2-aminobenzoate-CoA ligase